MNYKTLVLSVILSACFLEIEAMKKVKAKKTSTDISRAYAQATEGERRAVEALVELGKVKEKPTNLSPKKKSSKKTR